MFIDKSLARQIRDFYILISFACRQFREFAIIFLYINKNIFFQSRYRFTVKIVLTLYRLVAVNSSRLIGDRSIK